MCKRFFADDHEALEALNDGMMKVYKNIGKFRDNEGTFFNWIYTIVRNSALDKLKLIHHPPSKELSEYTEKITQDNPLKSLEWKDIYKLLDSLAPATRAVCSLFYLEGYSIKDISEKLSLSTGTVKWHLSETRNKLKPILKNYYS